MTTVSVPERKRGTLLTGILLLMLIANAWTIYHSLNSINNSLGQGSTGWETVSLPFMLLTGLAIANLFALGLLWRWQMDGLYLCIIVSLSAFAMNLIVGVPIMTILPEALGTVVLSALVIQRQNLFS
jgi:hypothetical protein